MRILFSTLWFIRTTKVFLFYFYLWQLKEYQVKRFIDHFRTAKGKRLIFNKINFLKILIAAGFIIFSNEGLFDLLAAILFILYAFEGIKTFFDLAKKKIKFPVLTVKASLLILSGIFVEILFLYIAGFDLIFILLYFDLISPLVASAIVLFFQPFAVLVRNRIVKKAINKRKQFKNLIVIGITGSYGKTSTKEFLATILSSKFNVLKTKEHQNSEIAIARVILNDLSENHQIFIAEMGAYRKGGIKLLSKIVQPKIGVVTGINEQHLALFGTMENLISAEGGKELIENLPDDGTAVLNANNGIIQNSKFKIQNYNSKFKNIIFCSTKEKEKMDFWADNIKIEKEFITFTAFSKIGERADFKINIIGGYNVENILLAVAVARELGMSLDEISKACQNIKQEQGSMVLKRGKGGINILDSSYSANPDGVLADLDYLKIWSDRKIIVMPCLIELGRASAEIHRKIGRRIAEVCDLAIITTKDWFEEIKRGAKESGMATENILYIENKEAIISKLSNYSKEDTVLFEGRVSKEIIESLLNKTGSS